MSERKNIKVDEDVFRELVEHKGEHQSWNDYLLDLKDAAMGGPVVGVNEGSVEEIAEAVERRIKK